MEGGLLCRTSVWRKKLMLWLCSALSVAAAKDGLSNAHPMLSLTAPHLYYTCPVGASVKLLCAETGAIRQPSDIVKHFWFFTAHSDQHCSGREGPRHFTYSSHSQGNHNLPSGLKVGFSDHNFWMVLENVTHADQGRYCCAAVDIRVADKHGTVVQRTHNHIILHITPWRNGSQDCTVWDPTPSGGSVPVALAIAACILALLSLPLILVLVYKQRENAHSSRRAQELVRMDSEALGHENPVFLGGSPQIKTRTVSQIMTRQSSETGRHLLSEPGTPLSPPAHGDVFFPIEDTIPESPDFLQV